MMRIYFIFVVIFFADFYGLVSSTLPNVPGTVVIPPDHAPPPKNLPPLSIYYDAMDENSQVFFNTTLVKQFASFSSYINITFIPCQQAKEEKANLTCYAQADRSCTLNKIHSCAIAQSTDNVQLVEFLACTMTSVVKIPDYSKCATENKLDDKELQSCATSDKGTTLCKDHSLQKIPGLSPIPGFFFKNSSDVHANDPFECLDNFENDVLVTDFTAAVCAHLKATNATSVPDECNKKLVFTIFYTAMGLNSQIFFQNFAKEYKQFSNYLTIKYMPCMYANYDSSGKFNCQNLHDPDCVAGKTHACAISIITDQTLLFQFLNCTMQDSKNLPDFKKCATDNKISYEPIKSCAESDRGTMLCYNYSKARPNDLPIPMFSYEMTFDQDASEATLETTSLKTVFCVQMKKYGIIKPPDCT